MRYFLENFEATHNTNNIFGAFPEWKYYPKTGTHVGTDFRVVVGTSILAPADGEMFKVEVNQYKGNVGVYVFDHQGTTWGLELCHLKELPTKGSFKEGDVIAYSGNTGSATTGAHLHAVLHRDAKVTKNYQELQSREDFLRLEKDGAILDCFQWFCAKVKEVTEIKPEPKIIEISVSETIVLHDSIELKTFAEKVKDFIAHIISGWFPSKRTDLSPDGVHKERVIDRVGNRYKERIVDAKTGRVIRDVDEKLTDHK